MNRLSLSALTFLSVIGGAVSHGQTMSLDLPDESGTPQDTLVSTTAPPVTEAEMAGYYPTASDLFLLGDQDYPRRTFSQEGPDARAQLASDIFMYESGEQDFYARNRETFAPINRVLGVFTPQKAFTAEFSTLPLSGITLDAGFPIFTRTFEPRNAHVKLGPLAFDLLWLGAGALWSDFNGDTIFPEGQEDGWISFLEVAVRGNLQITDTIHLSLAANLMYLPGTNEIALSSLNNGFPNVALDLFFQRRVGDWDLLFYNQAFARPGLDVFSQLAVDGLDQAGRYRFGLYGAESRIGTYNSESVWLGNHVAGRGTTMIADSDWRLTIGADHFDFWRTFDFVDHNTRDSLEISTGYEGNNIPFSPVARYVVSTYDQFDSYWHRFDLTFTGRVTENIRLSAMGGYAWNTGSTLSQESYLWSLTATHQFSKKGEHQFSMGQNIFEDPYSPEVQLATYYNYSINYQLAKQVIASGFAQLSNGDYIVSTEGRNNETFETFTLGATLSYRPLDFTQFLAFVAYENADFIDSETERWIYRLTMSQQLISRLTLETLYQYEDFQGSSSFNEHLVSMSLRWFF